MWENLKTTYNRDKQSKKEINGPIHDEKKIRH
jgi:hypothetical protein